MHHAARVFISSALWRGVRFGKNLGSVLALAPYSPDERTEG